MPRRPDAALEGRIVDVAYRLWSQRGEEALTMRAVARAARTTTPTVYHRFRDKEDLKHFLEERARQKMYDALQSARTALDVCRNALEFISTHGHEYRLLTADWGVRYAHRTPMRSYDYLKQALAKELGREGAQLDELAFQLFALVHGTALLRPAGEEHEPIANALSETCLKACAVLLQAARARTPSDSKRKSR
jgi:AcrR family transcriptional regulator